jgi:dTDP-D-glucose 4,6-dehydratase
LVVYFLCSVFKNTVELPTQIGRGGNNYGPFQHPEKLLNRCRSIVPSIPLFGAAKVAADIIVQEYGRYFQLRTGVFAGVVA